MLFRNDEALAHAEPAVVANPNHPVALYFAGAAYLRLGKHGKAIEVIERAVQVMDRLPFYLGWAGWAYGIAGREAEARVVLDELRARSTGEYVLNTSVAWILGALGEHDEAFEYFGRTIDEHEVLMGMAYLSPFDAVRDDPRFQALLRRMNFPETARS